MDKRVLEGWLVLTVAALAGCSSGPSGDAGDAAGDATDVVATDVVERDVAVDDAADVPVADGGDVVLADATDGAPGDGGTPCTLRRVLVTTTDFATGGYVVGDLATRTLMTAMLPAGASAPDQNHVVRQGGCLAFDLWRTPGTVAVIDPSNPFVPVRTIPLDRVPGGPDGGTRSANPEDLAVVAPNKAYVLQYTSARIAVIDPTRSGAAARTGSIDLSPLADADGVPEAEAIAVVGNRAYVALQQLTAFRAPARSTVAVIDTTTDTLVDVDPSTAGVQGIPLSFGNPMGIAVSHDGVRIAVTSVGNYDAPGEGGVDVIGTGAMRVQRSFSTAMLGGKPSSAEFAAGNTLWVSIATPVGDGGMNRYAIISVDAANGMVNSTPIAQSTTVAYGALRRAPDGTVWAIDTGFGLMGSVHAFSATGMPLLAMPFRTPGVNTYSLDFVP